MTNEEVWSAVVRWVKSATSVVTIKSHEGGKEPALPYVMINFTGSAEVRQHEQTVEYTDTGIPNAEGENEISAAPVIEVEWRFSIHAYGPTPTDILRPVTSASKLPQIMEPMMPDLVIHDVSQVRNVPDWINNRWEPRAQLDFIVRGLTRDGFIFDTVDETSFDIARAE
ncbi:phage neck terminator protein [Rhizobium sp. F40D2]|uniref:phage neck terminator protein n=1 Tax=Rhizobium sp. F40D2 TaxID=3453141 RepID=UPI003F21D656